MRSWTLAIGAGFSLIALAIGGRPPAHRLRRGLHDRCGHRRPRQADKAVNDLVAYSQDFGAFLASASPNLPKSVVADLVKHHVVTLKSVVDAQAAKEYATAYANERTAAGHMQQIADPLAEAIVKQFPDRYRG
jgi:hypothetical protein